MTDDYRQTVNLKEKMDKETILKEKAAKAKEQKLAEREKAQRQLKKKKRAAEIDRVFNSGSDDKVTKKELSQITRPIIVSSQETLYKRIVVILGIVVVVLVSMWMFMKPKDVPDNSALVSETSWYAVELVTGEKYYGQIADISADPVVIDKVYYNYDQLNKEDGAGSTEVDSGNLRLVKRGKETHGPTGEMSLIRAQVKYMEPLGTESKVLRAILEYEK